jgi:glycosyltransferase involved in cell wall biosynthesis
VNPASAFRDGKVAVICDWNGPYTGIGRYWRMLHGGLRVAGLDAVQVTPVLPRLPAAAYQLLELLGRDLRAFLTNYPLWCWYPDADIYHLAQQALASLLLIRRPRGKVIVTVHDIFPHLLRNDPWFRLAVLGLERADHLIAISHYTKRSLVDHLGIRPEKITVVYHGIDHERFRPLSVASSIRDTYRLPEGRRYLIYVGSEDPRKNLVTLVRALAQVRRELPDVELIKAGRSHCAEERQCLVGLAAELGVLKAIHFLEDVQEEHLAHLYNLAELYVTPSLYEGFGFPLLEAMACGTPVVYADAGSLPEIAGSAGIAVAPVNADSLARGVLSLLRQRDKQAALRAAGRERAASFTWTASTQSMLAVYEKMMHGNSDHAGDGADRNVDKRGRESHDRELEQAGGGRGPVRLPDAHSPRVDDVALRRDLASGVQKDIDA